MRKEELFVLQCVFFTEKVTIPHSSFLILHSFHYLCRTNHSAHGRNTHNIRQLQRRAVSRTLAPNPLRGGGRDRPHSQHGQRGQHAPPDLRLLVDGLLSCSTPNTLHALSNFPCEGEDSSRMAPLALSGRGERGRGYYPPPHRGS